MGRDCGCRPQHEHSDRPLQPYVPKNQVLGRHPSALADFLFVLAGDACSDLDPHQRPGYRQLQEGGQGPAGRMESWARALPSAASARRRTRQPPSRGAAGQSRRSDRTREQEHEVLLLPI